MKKLIINRKRWGTGKDGGSLLGSNGKMCCLGFACRQVGFKPSEIKRRAMPNSLGGQNLTTQQKNSKKWKGLGLFLNPFNREQNRKITAKLAAANDSTSNMYQNNPTLREQKIANLFSLLGVKVEFIN